MTRDEYFEATYLLDDVEYLKRFCFNEAEAYEIQKSLSYDNSCWLFEKPVNYCLEDDYTEDSMP